MSAENRDRGLGAVLLIMALAWATPVCSTEALVGRGPPDESLPTSESGTDSTDETTGEGDSQ